MHIRMNNAVASDFRLAANVSMRRIEKSRARFEHQAPDGASTYKVFELGYLCATVESRYFAQLLMLRKTDAFGGPLQDRRDIGQIVFAVAVRWAYFFQGAEEFFAVETISA